MEKSSKVKLLGTAAAVIITGSIAVAQSVTPFPTTGYSTDTLDSDGQGIENVVTVTGTYYGPDGVSGGTDDVDVSDNAFENVDVVASDPSVTVTKTADKTSDVAVGDTITYTYVVTNNGNVTLNGVTLSDNHVSAAGSNIFGVTGCSVTTAGTATTTVTTDATNGDTIGPFAPNAVVTCTSTYEVTQDDVDQLQLTTP